MVMSVGLVVDAGNTNTRLLFFKVESSANMSSSIVSLPTAGLNVGGLEESILSQLETLKIERSAIDGVLVASVVPTREDVFKSACINALGLTPDFLSDRFDIGCQFGFKDTETYGADRIANMVGGLAEVANYPNAADRCGVLVVDIGTGMTWDLASPSRHILGGAIAAGPMTALGSLTSISSKISKIEMSPPQSVIGTSTAEALRSGHFMGYASMVDGMIRRFRKEVDFDVECVATGGLSKLICDFCEEKIIVDKGLTFKGLKTIFLRNQRKK